MKAGDCLLVEKTNRRFDVFKIVADGARELIHQDAPNIYRAARIARENLAPDGCEIFYKHDAEPDSAIRPWIRLE